MSDPRFAKLKTDPRFRRPKKHQSKIVVDDRFKKVFQDDKKKKGKGSGRVDKYGRPLSENHERDSLKKFYGLENNEEADNPPRPDYARGEVLLESSDEEQDDESDGEVTVTLGRTHSEPIHVHEDAQIDLDEDAYADLDAQAAAFASEDTERRGPQEDAERTRRIAVVNLDWDHVRAIHLYKVFSSLVSPTAAPKVSSPSNTSIHPDRQRVIKGTSSTVVRGKILNVRVYPSEFGKERMAREEKEGPPAGIFKKKKRVDDRDFGVNEQNIYETGDGNEYDDDALRKYQLERLRYYYAIVTCDTVETASHIYSELEGTELERSANVFDLSFVPDEMTFDQKYRDESSEDTSTNYKGIDFVTDALRHSKVKLTWDQDDPERHHITRRALTKTEIEEGNFKAYLASSESESDAEYNLKSHAKSVSRDKLRALLLGGDDDELPEGWGKGSGEDTTDVDMEITFTPGISGTKDDKEETTLEKYERKMKEKRKKRKDGQKETIDEKEKEKNNGTKDNFFDSGSEEDSAADLPNKTEATNKGKTDKTIHPGPKASPRQEPTAEELTLLAASDDPSDKHRHFNLKSVLEAEKKSRRKGKGGKRNGSTEHAEIQEDFIIDVKDNRFKALHEDHTFAIDPTNPHFKKTKSMTALLNERSRWNKLTSGEGGERRKKSDGNKGRSLESLVESVKRKSENAERTGNGKRRRV